MEKRNDLEQWVTCQHSVRCLRKNGINTMEELSMMSYDDLLAFKGIGPVIAEGLTEVILKWHSQETGIDCRIDENP